MLLPSLLVILARQLWRLVAWSVGLVTLLSLILALGQCLRLRQLIWPLDDLGWILVNQLLWGAVVILSEAALPIAALIAPMLVGAQSQRTGLVMALESVGKPSAYLHLPALVLGVILASLSGYSAHVQTPMTLQRLGQSAAQLSEARWRQILPLTITRLIEKTTKLGPAPQIHQLVGQALDSAQSLDLISDQQSQQISNISTQTSHDAQEIKQSEQKNTNTQTCDWSTWVINTQDQEIRETWLWGWSPCRDVFISAHWPDSEHRADQDTLIELHDVQLISPHHSISLHTLSVPLSGPGKVRIQKVFGPPNSLEDRLLNLDDIHHLFILHKRSSLPLCALILSILGSCWGIRISPIQMLIYSVGALAITFGLLRQLELLARADYIPVLIAAWTPLALLSVWMITTLWRSTIPTKR